MTHPLNNIDNPSQQIQTHPLTKPSHHVTLRIFYLYIQRKHLWMRSCG